MPSPAATQPMMAVVLATVLVCTSGSRQASRLRSW
jgi:hypothetical protein